MKEKIIKINADEVVKLVTSELVEWTKHFVYLNGRPVDAVSADVVEGWVEVLVRDRHNKVIQRLGDDLKVVTAKVYGLVQIVYQDTPPKDWTEDGTLGDTTIHNWEEKELLITNKKKEPKDGKTDSGRTQENI